MKIGDEIYVHGFVDEIRKDVVIIKNDGGYFGTVPSEIIHAEQEQTDEWQNGYDRGWEEAEVFYEKEEPTIPCDLCGFNMDDVCEYLSVCPATGKAVSK